jgi:hypothetical protein
MTQDDILTDGTGRFLIACEPGLGMPLHPQTGRLHRAHVRLSRTEVAQLLGRSAVLVIDTRTRRTLPPDARPVADADPALVARIALTIARAWQAEQFEQVRI